MAILLTLFLLLLSPIPCFPQETTTLPPLIYKMVSVWGAPDPETSFPMVYSTGVSWDDCIQLCYNEPLCAMVYGNSSLICVQYYIGDVSIVRNDKEESGAVEKVSFKIEATTEEQKLCTSLDKVLKEAVTTVRGSFVNSYKVVISNDLYTISNENILLTTDEYSFGPQAPCDEKIQKAIIGFRGTLIQRTKDMEPVKVQSWFGCLAKCFYVNWCFIAEMSEAKNCYIYTPDKVTELRQSADFSIKQISEDNAYLAMKYVPNGLCPLTVEDMFTKSQMRQFNFHNIYTLFHLQPNAGNTKIEPDLGTVTCKQDNALKITGIAGCYRVFNVPTTHDQAVAQCAMIKGDGLMTIPDTDRLYEVIASSETLGFESDFTHVGLTRSTADSPWEWTLPGLARSEDFVNTSGPTLSNSTGLYAALYNKQDEAVLLYSISDTTVVGAFMCHFNS